MTQLYLRIALLAVFGGILVWPAIWNMVTLWLLTDTYLHGAIVLPLCFMLAKQMKTPSLIKENMLKTATITVLWLAALAVANQSFFNTLIQLVYLSLIPLSVYSLFGLKGVWHYRAPIMLSYLCIPFGDSLVPYLQSLTADMSVWLLQLSDVSVWRQGWYISIVNADFRVAEACSGVNFLISTIVLSVFFAFMEMKSWKKRLFFILLGATVPVIANGLRVYLIIMIAEMGYVEAATGFDHLVYGWIFFVVILAILGLFGYYIRDKDAVSLLPQDRKDSGAPCSENDLTSRRKTNTQAFIAFTVSVALFLAYSDNGQKTEVEVSAKGDLKPVFHNADKYCFTKKPYGEKHVISYYGEGHDKKILSINNRWFDGSRWSISDRAIFKDDKGTLFDAYVLVNIVGERRTLLGRYIVGENSSHKAYMAKVYMWIDNVMLRHSARSVELIMLNKEHDTDEIDRLLSQSTMESCIN